MQDLQRAFLIARSSPGRSLLEALAGDLQVDDVHIFDLPPSMLSLYLDSKDVIRAYLGHHEVESPFVDVIPPVHSYAIRASEMGHVDLVRDHLMDRRTFRSWVARAAPIIGARSLPHNLEQFYAVYLATRSGSIALVEDVLQEYGLGWDSFSLSHLTCAAVRSGNTALVKRILRRCNMYHHLQPSLAILSGSACMVRLVMRYRSVTPDAVRTALAAAPDIADIFSSYVPLHPIDALVGAFAAGVDRVHDVLRRISIPQSSIYAHSQDVLGAAAASGSLRTLVEAENLTNSRLTSVRVAIRSGSMRIVRRVAEDDAQISAALSGGDRLMVLRSVGEQPPAFVADMYAATQDDGLIRNVRPEAFLPVIAAIGAQQSPSY